MPFSTTINCIDGQVQLLVMRYLQKKYDIEYVDSITEAAPNRILAIRDTQAQSILDPTTRLYPCLSLIVYVLYPINTVIHLRKKFTSSIHTPMLGVDNYFQMYFL